MDFIDVQWRHNDPEDPIRLVSELDAQRYETRKLEFFAEENTVLNFDCGSNLRGWKIFKATKILRDAPDTWIWLRRSSGATSQAGC